MRKDNCYEGGRRNGWEPKGNKTIILKQIEFDKRILNELRNMAEADGVKSVYQMIRNACYHYVQMRKKTNAGNGHVQTDETETWTV